MSPKPGSRATWWSLAIVIAIALVAVGVAVGMVVVPQQPPDALKPGNDPIVAPALVQQFDDQRAVTLAFDQGPDMPLVLHSFGTITGMPSSLALVSGEVAVWVDGAPLIALATTAPLYRDLGVNDKGADVAVLNAELLRLGYAAPMSDIFTKATRNAWLNLQKADGVVKPAARLALGSVVWLPGASVRVLSWPFTLGSPTPANGMLGVVPGEVESATVTMADNSPLPSDSRTVTVQGQSTVLPADGVVTDSDFLARGVTFAVPIAVNGNQMQLQAQGTIQLSQPLTVLAVPPAALFDVVGSGGCIQVGDHGIAVTVVGSSLGVSLVQIADGSQPTQVAIGAGITATEC